MKKLLFFLMLGAVALGIAGCNPDEPNSSVVKGDTDYLSNFEVTIADATTSSAKILVTSADQNIYYYVLQDLAANAPSLTPKFIEDFLQTMYQQNTYPEYLPQKSSVTPVHFFEPGERHVVLMFAVKEGYKIDGKVEYMFFNAPTE